MQVKGFTWLGIRTDKFAETAAFFQRNFGLSVETDQPNFVAMRFPNGDKMEVFGAPAVGHSYFTNPVVGFEVDDLEAARAELEAQGVEFLGPSGGSVDGTRWAHFRGPDGFTYELSWRA